MALTAFHPQGVVKFDCDNSRIVDLHHQAFSIRAEVTEPKYEHKPPRRAMSLSEWPGDVATITPIDQATGRELAPGI